MGNTTTTTHNSRTDKTTSTNSIIPYSIFNMHFQPLALAATLSTLFGALQAAPAAAPQAPAPGSPPPAPATPPAGPGSATYWVSDIKRQGKPAFGEDANYKVFR